jgi:dienelactone hydrolase
MRGLITIALLLLLLLPETARTSEVTELPGLLRQALSVPITMPDGQTEDLDGLVTRPDRPGRFPLVLITNGLPRDGAEIPLLRPQMYSSPAIMFAQHGYAAVVVLRSGYGRSGGTFRENSGACDNRHYRLAAQHGATDVLAALAHLRGEAWVDPDRIVLVGHSMGGFVVLAASASNPSGVVGAISFAGAAGSIRPDAVCQPERLIEADTMFGRTTRVPGLWIFARNDHFFGPALARQMFDAYVSNGAPASLFLAPDHGRDGHTLILAPGDAPGEAPGEATWWPTVAAFLDRLHLPTRPIVTLPPLPSLAEPAPLDPPGHKAFAVYAPSRLYEKAFAIDPAGHYGMALGQRTQQDAERAAMKDCQRMQRVCTVYAVGNEITPAPAPLQP